MNKIETILSEGSLAELRDQCDPETAATYQNERGEKSLWLAAQNSDPQCRFEIMTYLLNNGADARYYREDGMGILHVMYSSLKHDFAGEAAITDRLVDGGADINKRAQRAGTPLEELIRATAHRPESDVNPLYRAIFSRPELNLHQEAVKGESVAIRMLKAEGFRPQLAEYIRAWLSAHPK